MLSRGILLPLFLVAGLSSATAGTAVGNLSDASPRYQGYRYSAYKLQTNNEAAEVAVRSGDFDSVIVLISSSSRVMMNDDHAGSSIPNLNEHDAAISIPAGAETWTLVVTGYDDNEDGRFEIVIQGVGQLAPETQSVLDNDTLQIAFEARGVENEEANRRRELTLKVDQLSLNSYRQAILSMLRKEVAELNSAEHSGPRIEDLEARQQQLTQALAAIEQFGAYRELIKPILQKEFEDQKSKVEEEAEAALERLSKVETREAFIREISDLSNAADQISTLERQLQETTRPDRNLTALRSQLLNAKRDFKSLSEEVGKRMLEVGIDLQRSGQLNRERHRTMNDRLYGRLGPMSGRRALFLRAPAPALHYRRFFSDGTSRYSSRAAPSEAPSERSVYLPQLFPWPPPDASARGQIDRHLFNGAEPKDLGALADILAKAMADAGYTGAGYLGVPGGFAMVSRIEQTDDDGRPLEGEGRWAVDTPSIRSFTIAGYLRALLTSEPGYFRVVVLIATDERYSMSGARGRLQTLERWARQGLNALARSVRDLPFTEDHIITALIYEFEKPNRSDDPVVRLPGRHDAVKHLMFTRFAGYVL